MKKIFSFVSLFLISTVIFANSNEAFQLYYRGEYGKSYPLLVELASKKDPNALYLLANIKLYGYGESRDTAKGMEYMHLAAESGNFNAQMFLGAYYLNDKKDAEKSFSWLKKAADQGDAKAQAFVGLCYLYGVGTSKNLNSARTYFIKSARNGVALSQYELGKIFQNSRFEKDRRMGRVWVEKAKRNGYSQSNDTNDVKQDVNLQTIENILGGAKISILVPSRQAANDNETIEMPVYNPLSEDQIIKPDYSLLTAENIPLNYIITQINKQVYQSQDSGPLVLNGNLGKLPKFDENEYNNHQDLLRQVTFGHIPAKYELGLYYANKNLATKGGREALDLFFQAAKIGYVKAEYIVGLYCLNGWVVNKSVPHALFWLRRAALHGSENAQFLLGRIYEHGLADEQSNLIQGQELTRARAMYSLAASAGVSSAQYRLALMYASDVLNKNNNTHIRNANLKIARDLYKRASDDIPNARILLSYFYLNKHESKEKQDFAYETAKTYSEKDNDLAKILLAISYDRGVGVSRNIGKALSIFKNVRGYASFVNFMIGTYEYTENNRSGSAIKYLSQAAMEGDTFAKYNLAIIAKKENNKQFNFVDLIKESADGGFNKASLLLADYYLAHSGNDDSAKYAAMIYHRLSEKGNSAAQLKIGYMYQHGVFYEKNYQKAIEWYKKSAENGNKIAYYQLGEIYQLGLGVKRDINLALMYYKKSANQYFVPAMVAIGYIMQVDEANYNEAKSWYDKAVTYNSKQAARNLSLLKKYGNFVSSNS